VDVQYTAFRRGHPDVFLAGDLGVKNALKKIAMKNENQPALDVETVSPWGSYATLLLWQSLSTDVGDNT
jgi:3-methyladenine DNA glycosylase/8-oxoguanine DNA glycosylase